MTLIGMIGSRSERMNGKFCMTSLVQKLAMSVSTTSTFLFEANHSRSRDMEPFHPNQSMKPTAPWRGNFSVFAIDPARGLSLSR
jgi:hypothetical protein